MPDLAVLEALKAKTHPMVAAPSMVFLKPLLADHTKAEAGDWSYYHDSRDPTRFGQDNIRYAFDFIEDRLTIGKYCSVAEGATFLLNGGNHFADRLSSFPFAIFAEMEAAAPTPWPNRGGISIGHDVWIGWGATILPGVSIGHGAIIAAQSVVTRNVAPYEVVAGNPGEVKKLRLPESDIAQLLALQWWDWPDDVVAQAGPHLMNHDIQALVAFAKAHGLT